ncbi:MAG TPA: NAD(P)/FAD-dependent oxidoreductase, partial [Hyphomicrobiaceae bacterium]|nr:NAD(P)/FAD-dependent oxidoreductase [Hyphomicrobiaceae bacterium]
MADPYDTIIVGGGPAGLSAALVLGRCLRRVLVCDSGRYRNERSRALHCFLSQDGVPPAELLARAREQLAPYNSVGHMRAWVSRVDRNGAGFVVSTDAGDLLNCRTVLVATGVVDELPQIEGIEELFGSTVHVCPYCDGWEHRGAPVAVFGDGSKSARLALLLRQWTNDLVLCTHGPSGLGPDDLARLKARGIAVHEQRIRRLEGADGRLKSVLFGDGTRLDRQALFFSTGQHPRSALLEKLGCRYGEKGVDCDEDGKTSI